MIKKIYITNNSSNNKNNNESNKINNSKNNNISIYLSYPYLEHEYKNCVIANCAHD